MAKKAEDVFFDQSLNYLANNVTEIRACTAEPTDRANAITLALATATGLTSGDWTGPANGDVSGRKITFDGVTGDTVDTGGTATHVALSSASALIYTTTCTSQVLTASNPLDYGSFDIEIADPT